MISGLVRARSQGRTSTLDPAAASSAGRTERPTQ